MQPVNPLRSRNDRRRCSKRSPTRKVRCWRGARRSRNRQSSRRSGWVVSAIGSGCSAMETMSIESMSTSIPPSLTCGASTTLPVSAIADPTVRASSWSSSSGRASRRLVSWTAPSHHEVPRIASGAATGGSAPSRRPDLVADPCTQRPTSTRAGPAAFSLIGSPPDAPVHTRTAGGRVRRRVPVALADVPTRAATSSSIRRIEDVERDELLTFGKA